MSLGAVNDPPPLTPAALRHRGARHPDVLLLSGDAYVDHPSFGVAIVARLLESWDLVVAIAAQPDWRDAARLASYGCPRLFIGITAGNMDSMVNHLTAHRKRRHDDSYSPGGRYGLRPNRATIVYAQLARQAFPESLIILGGVEASLRRFAHYDYWSDSLRRSILMDARADLLVYGMAERPLRTIIERLTTLPAVDRHTAPLLYGIRGTGFLLGARQVRSQGISLENGRLLQLEGQGWPAADPSVLHHDRSDDAPATWTICRLPAYERMQQDPLLLARATRQVERTAFPDRAVACVQRHGQAYVVMAPPAWPLSTTELDAVHELPFTRQAHPSYDQPVPAAEMIRASIQITRGCFGGCTFCAITLHEGRTVQCRSEASILREVELLRDQPFFRGVISDLGGPTANMWRMGCRRPEKEVRCRRSSCLFPRICPLLRTDHTPLRALLQAVREAPGVRRVIISSGIRHDLALTDPAYIEDLVRYHVGGHLHVAPEHSDPTVLRLARKPAYAVFEQFRACFERARQLTGVECYLNPYFVSGLPGSTDARWLKLVNRLRAESWRPRQVQGFIPTPGSLATAMFYSGVNPARPTERVEMPRTPAEKIRQHRLFNRHLEKV